METGTVILKTMRDVTIMIMIIIAVCIVNYNMDRIANSLETIASPPKQISERVILKQYRDERGLTSLIYTEGKDTFGYDFLTPSEYDSIFPDFYNGQILYPDYAHDDTLIVFNAKELNRIFDGVDLPIPASDEEIDEVLHMYAISINQRIIDILPIKGDSTIWTATLQITH